MDKRFWGKSAGTRKPTFSLSW